MEFPGCNGQGGILKFKIMVVESSTPAQQFKYGRLSFGHHSSKILNVMD